MSAEKISDLDRRVSLQEASLNRVLEAVEKQTNSMKELSESVAKMTTRFDYVAEELKGLKEDVRQAKETAASNELEIAVIKRGTEWMKWMERGIVAACLAALFWAVRQSG